jgi:hypothetical protein
MIYEIYTHAWFSNIKFWFGIAELFAYVSDVLNGSMYIGMLVGRVSNKTSPSERRLIQKINMFSVRINAVQLKETNEIQKAKGAFW